MLYHQSGEVDNRLQYGNLSRLWIFIKLTEKKSSFKCLSKSAIEKGAASLIAFTSFNPNDNSC